MKKNEEKTNFAKYFTVTCATLIILAYVISVAIVIMEIATL